MDFTFDDDQPSNPPVVKSTRKRGLTSPTIVEPPVKKNVVRQRVPTSAMDVDFDRPVERNRKKVPGKVTYMGPVKSAKSSLNFRRMFDIEINLSTIGWLSFGLLLLRLLFMERGVVDFYKYADLIKQRQMELKMVEQDNIALVEEIERIKTNPSHQKSLAREHLGVIARDEYLVLFSQEAAPSK